MKRTVWAWSCCVMLPLPLCYKFSLVSAAVLMGERWISSLWMVLCLCCHVVINGWLFQLLVGSGRCIDGCIHGCINDSIDGMVHLLWFVVSYCAKVISINLVICLSIYLSISNCVLNPVIVFKQQTYINRKSSNFVSTMSQMWNVWFNQASSFDDLKMCCQGRQNSFRPSGSAGVLCMT